MSYTTLAHTAQGNAYWTYSRRSKSDNSNLNSDFFVLTHDAHDNKNATLLTLQYHIREYTYHNMVYKNL